MNDCVIDFDPTSEKFLVAVPSWNFDAVRSIPYRRFNKSAKVWHVPPVPRNLSALSKSFGQARWTSRAKDALIAESNRAEQTARRSELIFPDSYPFRRAPRAHQKKALDFVYGNEASALFMEMRTGKTKVAIDYGCQLVREERINSIVVLCPLSARRVWGSEIAEDCPFGYGLEYLTTTKPKQFTTYLRDSNYAVKFLVASIEGMSIGRAPDMLKDYLTHNRALLIVDESTMIKNHKAERTRKIVKLGQLAEYRMILNGEPITQGIHDLYAQFEFLDPSIVGIGDFYSFRNRYCVMGGFEARQIVGYQNVDELMAVVGPHVFDVRKADVLDLPPKIGPITRLVKLSAEQQKAYAEIEKEGQTQVGEVEVNVANVLAQCLRLQQVVGGFAAGTAIVDGGQETRRAVSPINLPDKNPKIQELLTIVRQNDGPMIVWCAFQDENRMIAETLRGIYGDAQVVQFYGAIPEDQRAKNRDAFQNGEARFFIASQKAGGRALELSAARTVVFFSNTFSFDDRRQAIERAESSKLKHSVLYLDLVAEGTVDEKIMQAIDKKQSMADFVRASLKAGTSK